MAFIPPRVCLTFGLALLVLFSSCSLSPKPRKVFFVALGDFPDEAIDELVSHYEDKFSIRIEKLPRVPLDASFVDRSRNQIVAEALIALLREKSANLPSDPSPIVIGLTQEDIYIRKYTWRFAFNYREDDKFAVVSTARMDPINFGKAADEALLSARLRKMITKNIGILYFRKPLNNNPRSVLYGNVGGLEELDAMSEEF